MAKGAIAASATASELVPADPHRGEVIIQYVSGDPCFLEFGDETPVVDQGLFFSSNFKVIVINDHRAKRAVHGICDSGLSTVGTYTTDN